MQSHSSSLLVWLGIAACCSGGAAAQDQQGFPTRPIKIVAAQAGGQSDFVARILGPHLSGALGQSVVIENRGGSAVIAIGAVAKAPPDGYTILAYGSTQWILPMLQSVSYDAFKDFVPITLLSRSPNILVVHPSVPVKSVKDLVALAKARPGELNYASTIVGSATHLAAELFKSMAAVDIVQVPYKGAGAAMNDLLGGHVEIMFSAPGSVAGHIKAGRLRGIAVTSKESSPVMPSFPSIAASGLAGYESESMIAMFAPAGTPSAIASRLNQATVEALRRAEVKEKLLAAGLEAGGTSSEQLKSIMQSETTRMGKVIKSAGIRID